MSDERNRKKLEALSRATEDLAPTDALVDAVMQRLTSVEGASTRDLDERLDALARATEPIDAAPELGDAVMARVLALPAEASTSVPPRESAATSSRRAAAFADGLVRSGRIGLVFAAAVAAAAVLYASWTETHVYDEALVTADSIEVAE